MLWFTVNKPRKERQVFGLCFFFFYSQHSGARRAHEASHRDVGVSHPGLVALEAVFVYSRLGQLTDLAGAYLLVVPVLSVRHFIPPVRCLTGRLCVKPVNPPLSSSRSSSAYYARIMENAFMRLHPPMQGDTEERHVKSQRKSCTHTGKTTDSLQNKSKWQLTRKQQPLYYF